jgi:riboflavin kinase/FMN adenylyltransferase
MSAVTLHTHRYYCEMRAIDVSTSPMVLVDGQVVSSSRVRTLLHDEGDVIRAGALLTAPFELSGVVVKGAQRGRQLGFPTANLELDPALLVPRDGVYGGVATVRGERFRAAISVGTNPQFTAGDELAPRVVEVHLLDFDDDIYGEVLGTTFEAHIRSQGVFASVDELVDRINLDVDEVRTDITL